MSKLFLQINASLDGYIEDERREMDWHFSDDDFDAFINEMLNSIDAMIFGRVAFELLAQYWPTAGQNPDATPRQREAARLMHALPKYVVSNRLRSTDWHNAHIFSGDVIEQVRALKTRSNRDIALFAGAAAASSFLRAGLVDEIRLIVNPILFGAGTRLFQDGIARTSLTLAQTRVFRSGALLLTYRVGA